MSLNTNTWKSYIIWWALNSWKWMIPRILKNMSEKDSVDANPNISLSEIDSIDWIFDSIAYTDNLRLDYYNSLSDEDKIKLFPKFHLAKMLRLPVWEIMKRLWWEYWWNQAELFESELLFNRILLSYLRWLNPTKKYLSIWIWNTPEWVKQFLDESSNPEIFSTLFVVKTNVWDILDRLNQDKNDPNHANSWPLRLPEWQLYKAANLIAMHWLSVSERADKLWFRVIDTSIDSDKKLLEISKEIFDKQKQE